MQPAEQDRVIVVLVRARNPSNIGAVARAMHDLGYRRLRVVNEYPVPFAAARSAVHASSVLEAAEEFSTVSAAVADCTLVLGTTAVGERALEHPLYVLRDAAVLAREHLAHKNQARENQAHENLAQPEARVALLFGSEKTGLSNEELSYCHALTTIPMSTRDGDRHLSMNLGQAAAVCLYELTQPGARSQASGVLPQASRVLPQAPGVLPQALGEPAAQAADLDRIVALLAETLERSGYTRRHPANARPEVLRRLVRRLHLTPADAQMGMGLLRQVLHALRAEQ